MLAVGDGVGEPAGILSSSSSSSKISDNVTETTALVMIKQMEQKRKEAESPNSIILIRFETHSAYVVYVIATIHNIAERRLKAAAASLSGTIFFHSSSSSFPSLSSV